MQDCSDLVDVEQPVRVVVERVKDAAELLVVLLTQQGRRHWRWPWRWRCTRATPLVAAAANDAQGQGVNWGMKTPYSK